MDLHDEAIEQFQNAYRLTAQDGSNQNHIQCCHMLGFCFKSKAMPKVAVMWFHRGLKIPNSTEDEYQALQQTINELQELLADPAKVLAAVKDEYAVIERAVQGDEPLEALFKAIVDGCTADRHVLAGALGIRVEQADKRLWKLRRRIRELGNISVPGPRPTCGGAPSQPAPLEVEKE